VRIGQPENGFLPIKESGSFTHSGSAKPLITGAEALVQVKKGAKGGKGAFLSRDIALPGFYCVWMPLNRHIAVSGRVADEQAREELVALGRDLADGTGGVIMRHAALGAKPADIEGEIAAHKALWRELCEKAGHAKPPALLYREPSELTAMLRDHAARYRLSVFAVKDTCQQSEIPNEHISLTLHTDMEIEALWHGARIEAQAAEALQRKVRLPGGGTLVIDEREALSTRYVNSARFVSGEGESIALEQNLAACEEIARQVRLRNLGGILIIDFIDMSCREARERVQAQLKRCLAGDRLKTVVHGFSDLGLLEMTRKRTRASLSELLSKPCAACGETGRRPIGAAESGGKKGKEAKGQ
jgi:ribonuclease G